MPTLVWAHNVRTVCEDWAVPPANEVWLVAVVPTKRDANRLIESLKFKWRVLTLVVWTEPLTAEKLEGLRLAQVDSCRKYRAHWELAADARSQAAKLGIPLDEIGAGKDRRYGAKAKALNPRTLRTSVATSNRHTTRRPMVR